MGKTYFPKKFSTNYCYSIHDDNDNNTHPYILFLLFRVRVIFRYLILLFYHLVPFKNSKASQVTFKMYCKSRYCLVLLCIMQISILYPVQFSFEVQ